MAENIPREYEKKEEIEKAYEMVSEADIYLGRAFSTRAYTYWKYAYDFMSVGVALSKDETYKKFARYSNSTVYTMLSKSRGKRDLQDRVAGKIAEKLHMSKKVAKSQFPYFEIMFEDNETAYNMITYFGLEDNEVKLFRSKKVKIPKKTNEKKVKTDPKPSKTTKKVKKGSAKKLRPKKKESKNENSEKSSSKENSTKNEEKSENNEKQMSLFSFK